MENKGVVLDRAGCGPSICHPGGLLLLAAGVLWLLLAALVHPAQAAGTPTWLSAGSQVSVQPSNPLRNRRSSDATVAIQLANSGGKLAGPLRLVIGALSPVATVSIKNPSGTTAAGEPYFDLRPYLGGDAFAAQGSAQITVTVLGGGPNTFSMVPRVERQVLADQNFSVKITSPASLLTVGRSPVAVQGIVSDPSANLTLNGAPVTAGGDGHFSANVSLQQGHNTVAADAKNAAGQEVTDSISISLDMTPPYVTVESPKDGDTVYLPEVNVSGLVNDIVRGTVSEGQANVTVNGKTALVANRSYSASKVPLNVGANLIEVLASDQEGNTGKFRINITYQVPAAKRIELVSGDRQTATINTDLPNPLKARLLDGTGSPVPDHSVVFRVIQGDGVLHNGADLGQGILVKTGTDGIAAVPFTVGTRSGEGNQRVRATAVGFDGEVVFSESATSAVGSKVSVNSGNNQRGGTGQALPQPFVVVVTDAGANVVSNADVRFDVTQGGGSFQNGQASYTTKTDSDGRATAQLTLGAETGLDQQRVSATLVGTDLNAGFTASGFDAGAPGNTSISGVVLDNQDTPLPNVKVRVDGTTRQAQTDAEGHFLISNAPVGPLRLFVDGSTTTVPGEWPTLPFNLVTIAGVENPLSAPVHLVKLDTDTAVLVGEKDAEITLKEVPGFKLEVKAGSVTFPDGKKVGKLSVTPVNADKVPMQPPNGMQPQFIVTIQPVGAKFDPPARLTLPNVDGHKPGAQVEMYSFDHDLEEFVSIGVGTVSADGSVIVSNPGVGVIKAGWHCGSQPGGSGCATNPGLCKKCQGNCQIVPDDSQTPPDVTAAGDCKKTGCKGGAPTPLPDDSDAPDPKKQCSSCKNGQVSNGPNGSACDDGKFCTSFDGMNPGADQCVGGKCQGNKIPDKKTSEQVFEFDGGKYVALITDPIAVLEKAIKSSVKIDTPTIKYQHKEIKTEICCEKQKSILPGTAVEDNITGEVKGKADSPPLIVPTPVGNVNFIAKGAVALQLKGYVSESASTCDDPNQCNKKGGIQLSGSVALGLEVSYIHPNILSGEGQGKVGVSGDFSGKCGVWQGKACAGPFEIKGTVKALSYMSYSWSYVFKDSFVCTSSGSINLN